MMHGQKNIKSTLGLRLSMWVLSVWNLIHFTVLMSGILRWELPDPFCKDKLSSWAVAEGLSEHVLSTIR